MEPGVFRLYKSGIPEARVYRSEGGISYLNRSATGNTWRREPEERLRLNSQCLMDIPALFAGEEEFLKKAGQGDDRVLLSDARVYERCGPYRGATLWGQRGVKHPADILVRDGRVLAYIQPAREHVCVLSREGEEASTPLALWREQEGAERLSTVRHLGTQMLPMSDGTELATDVWLPADHPDKKLPAILLRTPYGRMRLAREELRYVRRGYALVAQDVRGKGDSRGEWLPFVHERDDGLETLRWIAGQPWSDGRVGMTGASYGAFVQWACADSPHLAAMVSLVTAGSAFADVPRKGGCLLSGMLPWLFATLGSRVDPQAMRRPDWDEVLDIRPVRDIFIRTLGQDPPFWRRWMSHPDDGDFWQRMDWPARLAGSRIRAASLILTGWYDDNFAGSMQAWECVRLQENPKQLVIGPWGHDLNTSRDIHGAAASCDALLYDIDLQQYLWFERYLRNRRLPPQSAVRYYTTGLNRWNRSETWPPAGTRPLSLYLDAGSRLSLQPGSDGWDGYRSDPRSPAPHCLDLSENEMGVPGNYRDVEKREDVLSYTGPLLEEPLTVSGRVDFQLFASSSARDTDWVIRLLDADGLGNSIKVAEGVLRARYRDSFREPSLLEPDRVYRFEIGVGSVSHCFKKGHALRISVCSAARGFLFPNPQTGADPQLETEAVTARQRIYRGPAHASRVILSIV